MTREFDSPWKDALDEFLEPALEMFHPELHADIDWSVGYELLDAELSSVVREAEMGTTDADRLFRVTLKNGQRLRLLIHAEVQSQHDATLPRRMFVYHYRVLDRYDEPLVGIAILGDESRTWRPSEYRYDHYGTGNTFRFRAIKLLDWRDRFDELLTGQNPIGVVVASHLQSLATGGQPEERSRAKLQLFRSLFDRGWTAEQFRKVYRLIDWFLELPQEVELQYRAAARAIEEEQKMPYIPSHERAAREEGLQLGRQEGQQVGRLGGLLDGAELGLRLKFGPDGQKWADELRGGNPTVDFLERLLKTIEATTTLTELRGRMTE